MIGDNYEADILGARNAHIDSIYFAYNKTIPENNIANYTITSLEQLRDILL
jgi:FMN phosphatase YigB (HAD superfamily)